MKRCVVFVLCLAAVAGAFLFPSAAYIYSNDHIDDPQEYQAMRAVEGQILGNGEETAGVAQLSLEDAVRLYLLSPEGFLLHIEKGTLSQVRENAGYCWKIPIYMDEETGAYKYVSFGYLDNGRFEYIVGTVPAGSYNMHEYLFYQEETLRRIYDAGVSKNSDIYVISISDVNMDIVVAEEEGRVKVIPFAARPDFLKLENGKVVSLEELAEKVREYRDSTKESRDYVPSLAAGGVVLLTAVYILRRVISGRSRT